MRLLPALLAGLALGATGAFALRHLSASPPASSASAASPLLVSGSSLPVSDPASSGAPGSLLLPRLAAAEADAALDAYLALPPFTDPVPAADLAERAGRLRALLTVLPTSSFPRLFATLATRAGKAEGKLRRLAFNVWIERDPAAVALWAAALVPSPALDAYTRLDYLATATLAWSEIDFDSAYAWVVVTLSDTKQGRRLAGGLLGQLATADPARAISLAQAGDAEFQAATRHAIFQAWAKNDPAAALRSLGGALLAEAKHGRSQDWQFRETVATWARRDPAAALDWLGAQIPPSPTK